MKNLVKIILFLVLPGFATATTSSLPVLSITEASAKVIALALALRSPSSPLPVLSITEASAKVIALNLDNRSFSVSYHSPIWGFFAHKRINRMAVFTLPEDMLGFYKKHIEFVTDHAVDPDKRRYAVKEEAARHYIDIDHYMHDSLSPFEVVPKKWDEAVLKFTEDTLQAYGIVPWHLQVMLNKLTWAFKNEEVDMILKYSSEIGHYIGDAHVPLHTTENYNGQLTGQRGIHGFWESRIPELLSTEYDFFIGNAMYIEKPLDDAWKVIKESNDAVDSVLTFERILNGEFPTDRKYAFEERGPQTIKTYSQEYTTEYSDRLDGMVERRMRAAILSVGSYWYTAWVNAGKPDLNKLLGKDISDKMKEEIENENKDYENGNVKGRSCDH